MFTAGGNTKLNGGTRLLLSGTANLDESELLISMSMSMLMDGQWDSQAVGSELMLLNKFCMVVDGRSTASKLPM